MGRCGMRHMVIDELEPAHIFDPDSALERIAQDRQRVGIDDAGIVCGNGRETAAGMALSRVVGYTVNLTKTDAGLRKARRDRHLREAARVLLAAQSFFLDVCNDHTVLEQNRGCVVPPNRIEPYRILGEKRGTANAQNKQWPHRRLLAMPEKKSGHLAASGGDAARWMPQPPVLSLKYPLNLHWFERLAGACQLIDAGRVDYSASGTISEGCLRGERCRSSIFGESRRMSAQGGSGSGASFRL